MRKLLSAVFLLSLTCALQATPVRVAITPMNIYIPFGHDSNDNVEVIVEGNLPNLCYSSPRLRVVERLGDRIHVELDALYDKEMNCAMISLPFIEKLSLGVLQEGLYDLSVNHQQVKSLNESLVIAAAKTEHVDDYIYANVQMIENVPGERAVYLKGSNPSLCVQLKEVKWISNKKNTYSILPIMEQVGDDCSSVRSNFSYKFEVPNELDTDRVLLHVRRMNGSSVNSIYYNN